MYPKLKELILELNKKGSTFLVTNGMFPEKLKELKQFDAVIVPGGFGSRGTEGKIKAIEFCRQNKIPFLGLCLGMQLAVVEFARNVCGLEGVKSTEMDPATKYPVIDILPEQKEVTEKGGTMRLGAYAAMLKDGSVLKSLYDGAGEASERHRHRYEVNPKHRPTLEKYGLIFSGKSVDGKRMEILELPEISFFFASQFHGEYKSRPAKPDPEYHGFVRACLDRKLRKAKVKL